jgi:hypothetical protein
MANDAAPHGVRKRFSNERVQAGTVRTSAAATLVDPGRHPRTNRTQAASDPSRRRRCWPVHPRRAFASLLRRVLCAWLLTCSNAPAASEAARCDSAARMAAAAEGVPAEVLLAITRVETGRRQAGILTPWPWTVNMEGEGRWFPDRASMLDYVAQHVSRGATSFDLGCFQINHRWHGDAFRSLDDMADPETGALYAARFLKRLHAETGDWTAAAAAYHSRTPVHAQRYRKRYVSVRAELADRPPLPKTPPAPPAVTPPRDPANRFPLLLSGEAPGVAGSLVPAGLAGVRPLFAAGG